MSRSAFLSSLPGPTMPLSIQQWRDMTRAEQIAYLAALPRDSQVMQEWIDLIEDDLFLHNSPPHGMTSIYTVPASGKLADEMTRGETHHFLGISYSTLLRYMRSLGISRTTSTIAREDVERLEVYVQEQKQRAKRRNPRGGQA